VAISGHQWQSVAVSVNQCQSVAVSVNQWQSSGSELRLELLSERFLRQLTNACSLDE
jgi:hypothetical protein